METTWFFSCPDPSIAVLVGFPADLNLVWVDHFACGLDREVCQPADLFGVRRQVPKTDVRHEIDVGEHVMASLMPTMEHERVGPCVKLAVGYILERPVPESLFLFAVVKDFQINLVGPVSPRGHGEIKTIPGTFPRRPSPAMKVL